jgi:hypothetical protein
MQLARASPSMEREWRTEEPPSFRPEKSAEVSQHPFIKVEFFLSLSDIFRHDPTQSTF